MKYWLRVGVQLRAKAQRGEQRNANSNRQSAEENSGYAGGRNQGNEYDDRGDGGEHQRSGDLCQGAANGLEPALSGVAMQGNILDHDDGIIDDQPHGRRQSAESHQIEALIEAA